MRRDANGCSAGRPPADHSELLRPPQSGLRPVGFCRLGGFLEAPEELVRVQRNSTRCRAEDMAARVKLPMRTLTDRRRPRARAGLAELDSYRDWSPRGDLKQAESRTTDSRGASVTRTNQRAGTWHELRATSARHWPMTHGRDRGAAEAANSACHGGECNLPAHLSLDAPESPVKRLTRTVNRAVAAASRRVRRGCAGLARRAG